MDDKGANHNCPCQICRLPLIAGFTGMWEAFDKATSAGEWCAALKEIVKQYGSGVASFHMVRRLQRILRSHDEHRVRTQAAISLREITLAQKDLEQMVELLIQCLHDEVSAKDGAKVQEAIGHALAKPASAGHGQRIVNLMSQNMLNSADAKCRRVALAALPLAFPEGDDNAADSTLGLIEDKDQSVRRQVLFNLPTLVKHRREQPLELIDAVRKCLDDDSNFVMNEALKVLPKILQPKGTRTCEDHTWERMRDVVEQKSRPKECRVKTADISVPLQTEETLAAPISISRIHSLSTRASSAEGSPTTTPLLPRPPSAIDLANSLRQLEVAGSDRPIEAVPERRQAVAPRPTGCFAFFAMFRMTIPV